MMPGFSECETYPDSLIEITIEHEGKTPVAKEINNNKKIPVEFFRQGRENQKDSLFYHNVLMYKAREELSEFRH